MRKFQQILWLATEPRKTIYADVETGEQLVHYYQTYKKNNDAVGSYVHTWVLNTKAVFVRAFEVQTIGYGDSKKCFLLCEIN